MKPFIKWVGGKTQLIDDISKNIVDAKKYCEPFIGGGAIFFSVLNNKRYSFEQFYISDINSKLINTYITIRDRVDDLKEDLYNMENVFNALPLDEKKKMFYNKRVEFNTGSDKYLLSVLFIFLNKSCFNGLYRVNSKGEFNVPIGRYNTIKLFEDRNLTEISEALKRVEIVNANYSVSYDFIDRDTFVYFDPPYRPLSNSSSFKSYNESPFGDKEQIELKNFIDTINEKGAKFLLSNSDSMINNDRFFYDLYSGYKIQQVSATRMLNSKSDKRGKISELLIGN